MFFNASLSSLQLLTVLSLSWQKQNERSGDRPFHALSFRIKGDARIVSDSGEALPLSTGDVAFVPANTPYHLLAGEEQLLVVHFQSSSPPSSSFLRFHSDNPAYLEHIFSRLFSCWEKKQMGYEYECLSLLYKLLSSIEKETALRSFSSADDRLLDAVQYIHDSFTDPALCIDSLTRLFGMSDTYFRRLFVRRFHITPCRYIRRLRLERAKELLSADYDTVEEIAEKCGFSGVYYFSACFKKDLGISPSAFRQRTKSLL